MSKVGRFLFSVIFLGLLTGGWFYLYFNSHAINSEKQKEMLDLIKDIKQMDSNWNIDVLKAQTEVIRSYDVLSSPLPLFSQALEKLDWHVKELNSTSLFQAFKEIQLSIRQKEILIDKFKSQDSLLKNSLRYAPTAYADIQSQFAIQDKQQSSALAKNNSAELEKKIGALLGEVFHYNTLPDPKIAEKVRGLIDDIQLMKEKYPKNIVDSVDNLIVHLEAILRLRPAQVTLLQAIANVPVSIKADAFNNQVITLFNNELQQQFKYQNFLLIYSAGALILIFGAVGVITYRNITERRRLTTLVDQQTKELKSSYARFAAMDEASPLGSFYIDAKGICTHVNPMFTKITGYTVPEMVGSFWNKGIHLEDNNKVLEEWKEAINKNTTFGAECRFMRQDGSMIWVNYKAAPIYNSDDILGYVGTIEDISDRKHIEKMKNEFIATVSHELRTPLTSIMGSLSLILGGIGNNLSADVKMLIEIAAKNSERLIRLINDILDIEKIESGNMPFDLKPVKLQSLIDQAIESNKAYGAKFGITYEIQNRLEDVCVNVDVDRLLQVLTNLMANAAKFSPKGATVELNAERHNGNVIVEVIDHGPGVPESFQKKIFGKFSQADSSDTRQKGGTGLGLSISKAIIESMEGQIGFRPGLNDGSIFYFELPEWIVPVAPTLPEQIPARPKILVCEDNQDVTALIGIMLDHAGYDAIPAYDAATARRLLAEDTFVAMTLDIGLPDIDGEEFLRELKTDPATRELPIVVVSAKMREALKAEKDRHLNSIDWITKPVDRDKLINAIRKSTGTIANGRSSVLHIEDDPDVRLILSSLCAEVADFDFAENFKDAADLLISKHYDLVILDIDLPDRSGWDLLPLIDKLAPRPQILVFSAKELSAQDAGKVAAALVKSHISNPELLQIVRKLSTGVK